MIAGEAQELLRRLRRTVVVEHKVAELRPPRDALGRSLQNYADLLQLAIRRAVNQQSIDAVQAEFNAGSFDEHAFDEFAWRPVSDSAACAERAVLCAAGVPIEDQQYTWHQDYSRTVSVIRRLTEALIDNLRSIALLLQDADAVRGPIALSRVVLDAAAHACFVLSEDISAAERIRRTLNEELSLLVFDYKVTTAEADLQSIADREAQFNEIQRVAESCGFHDFASMRAHDQQRRVITNIGPRDATSRMIDLALDNPGPFWHDLSAIVHSQEGMGLRLLLGLDSGDTSPQRDRYIAFHALPAVLIATRSHALLGAYMGWDFGDLDEPRELLMQLWALGSGFHDE